MVQKDNKSKVHRAGKGQPLQMVRPWQIPDNRVRRRFPESSNPTRQLQLLLWGSTPLLKQKAGGLMYRVRSFFSRLSARFRERTP